MASIFGHMFPVTGINRKDTASSSARFRGVEHFRHVYRKAVEQRGVRHLAAPEHAALRVNAAVERQRRDRFIAWVDDPVFLDACFGIVGAFINQIPVRVVGTEDFGYQIRAQPVTVLVPWIRAVSQKQQIRFAEFALANTHPQGGEPDDTAARTEPGAKQVVKKRQNGLVRIRGRRQFLDVTVGKFDQATTMIGEP